MKNKILLSLLTSTIIVASSGVASAAENKVTTPASPAPQAVAPQDEFSKALMSGKVLFNSRYRFEHVDQDGLAEKANANTLRTRLGYETQKFHDVSALVEMENITDVGSEHYNNTINGKNTYPTVGDIDGTHLNRAIISYSGIPQTNVNLGRQNIILDNQRWLGAVDWRQNDQTFDALTITNATIPNTSIFYGYANQVNKTLGDRSAAGTWDHSNIHLFNASYTGFPIGKIIGYSYLIDTPDSLASSTKTFGGRFEGKQAINESFNALLSAEYARQSDYADNTASYDLDYFSVEPGLNFGEWTVKAQYESIEGNGTQAVQFPLATLHAFNGWADKLTTTPANGLIDMNVGVVYVAKSDNTYVNGIKAQAFYHDYTPERGSGADYGTEWNASVEQTFKTNYTVGIKYANYQAESFATDTVKIMPYIQVKF